jgi:hypothetical protein
MTSEYIIPGTSLKEISVFIENDQNIRECNEDYFAYPQNFTKPLDINIKTYNYE